MKRDLPMRRLCSHDIVLYLTSSASIYPLLSVHRIRTFGSESVTDAIRWI